MSILKVQNKFKEKMIMKIQIEELKQNLRCKNKCNIEIQKEF